MGNKDNRKAKIGYCPNCGTAAIRTAKEVACESCDAIFEVTTVTHGQQVVKLKSIGIEERLKKCEDKLFPPEPQYESKAQPESTEDL